MNENDERILAVMQQAFRDGVPHNQAIGIELVSISHEEGAAVLRLPYDAKLVGDPESGILHGGAITTLLDATSGAAVFMKLAKAIPIATLDLRIDYLKPATPGLAVFARAECYKVTRNVAFVRSTAYHDPGDVIAAGMGTFMIRTKGQSVGGR
jgi:uncharacterized protein (TIGR00369 family)